MDADFSLEAFGNWDKKLPIEVVVDLRGSSWNCCTFQLLRH